MKQGNATAILHARKVEKGRLEIRLSDEIKVDLIVVAAKPDVSVGEFPAVAWEIEAGKPTYTPMKDGRFRWQQTFIVEPRLPETQELHLPELKYRTENEPWQVVKWKPIPVLVTTAIKKADAAQLRDIPGIEEPPPRQPNMLLPWMAVGGAAFLLATLAALLVLLLRRRAAPKAQIAPEQTALRELEQLQSSLPATQDEVEPFHTRLAEVVRVYAEQKYRVSARRHTSHEFIQAVAEEGDLVAEQIRLLLEFFDRCDLGKFAPLDLSGEECTKTIDLARAFVEQTSAKEAS